MSVTSAYAVYRADEVRELLDYDGCIDVVRAAMRAFSADGTPQPLREIITLGANRLFGLMPGALVSPQGFGAKILSVYADRADTGRSRHQGVVVLFDRDSGAVRCIADAEEVTRIRTAAASAVATEALARPESKTLAIFGCGVQAEAHVLALSRVRALETILVWGRSPERAERLVANLQGRVGASLQVCLDAQHAAEAADIICTVTSSPTPVLLGRWVRAGTHVNAVGSSHAGPVEIDTELLLRSRYIVDSRRSALAAAAEFLAARAAGLIEESAIAAEIGEVLNATAPGRTAAQEVTLYKSLGHIVQDLAAAAYVHAKASRRGMDVSGRTEAEGG